MLGPMPMDSANAKMVALAPTRKLSVCRALRMTMRMTAIIKSLHKEKVTDFKSSLKVTDLNSSLKVTDLNLSLKVTDFKLSLKVTDAC